MNKNVTLDITQQSWPCQFIHARHNVLYLSKIKWWWPPRIAILPALILDPHQQKWHSFYVCVGAMGTSNRTLLAVFTCQGWSYGVPSHLSRKHPIFVSFSGHFQKSRLYCFIQSQWQRTYFPPYFYSLSVIQIWLLHVKTELNIISEPPLLPPTAPPPPNEKRSRAAGIYSFQILLLIEWGGGK